MMVLVIFVLEFIEDENIKNKKSFISIIRNFYQATTQFLGFKTMVMSIN